MQERIGNELGHYMLSMVSNVLGVSSERLLAAAQTRDRALQRLRLVVGNVTAALPDFQHHFNKVDSIIRKLPDSQYQGIHLTAIFSNRG